VIAGGCPMMFCEPVDIGHKCMRWIIDVTGGFSESVVETEPLHTRQGVEPSAAAETVRPISPALFDSRRHVRYLPDPTTDIVA
jgi:hypothetical protein